LFRDVDLIAFEVKTGIKEERKSDDEDDDDDDEVDQAVLENDQ